MAVRCLELKLSLSCSYKLTLVHCLASRPHCRSFVVSPHSFDIKMSSFVKRSLIFSFPVILSQLKLVDAFAQCYYPDGSIPQDYVWEPCSGALYSSCCVPSEGDVCQENGLCYYPDVSNDGGFGTLYRGTCTDRTWTDAACKTNVCVSGELHRTICFQNYSLYSEEDILINDKIQGTRRHGCIW